MISPDYARMMARYNRWQNTSLYTAADTLSDAQRSEDRGAFFKSIYGTLCHLHWADSVWLACLSGMASPVLKIAESVRFDGGWEALKPARRLLDQRIEDWAASLTDEQVSGELTWFSGTLQRNFSGPRAELVVHFFNHQTHHRGQVHALLTGFGARPDDTDLPFMAVRTGGA